MTTLLPQARRLVHDEVEMGHRIVDVGVLEDIFHKLGISTDMIPTSRTPHKITWREPESLEQRYTMVYLRPDGYYSLLSCIDPVFFYSEEQWYQLIVAGGI